MTYFRNIIVAALLSAVAPSVAVAQSYYDDDIYYDADKAKKEQAEALRRRVQANYVPNTVVDYPGADTYVFNSGSTRDVDEYNRHNLPYAADTLHYSADGTETFACTRNIERFHNPDVVSGSDDDDLQYLYYTDRQQPATTVNIYVDGMYWNPYSYRYWSPVCSPWYDPWYSWSYGWGPAWGSSWSWSWSWGPGWYPGWGDWCPGGGWSHRVPHASSGASRPHYDYAGGSRPSYGRRDGYNASSSSQQQYRPGGSRPVISNGAGSQAGEFTPSYETRTGRRPGAAGYGTGGTSSGGNRNSVGAGSGRRTSGYGSGTSSGGQRRTGSYNSNNNNSNRSSNNSGYNRSNGGSRGSYGGGGRSSGGGNRGGGGGRGRH